MKIKSLLLMLVLSTPLFITAQNADVNHNHMNGAAIEEAPVTLIDQNKAFITRAKMRITDNEKSLVTMKATQNIKDKQELIYYKEKVELFETRNMEMNNKIYAFNVVSGTNAQFMEFKKRWHWAMDELSVYQKNLMTENFLNK
jgi:hypothetical protein